MQLCYDTAPLTLLTTWFVIPMFENSLKSWLLALTNGYIEKYTGIEFVCIEQSSRLSIFHCDGRTKYRCNVLINDINDENSDQK